MTQIGALMHIGLARKGGRMRASATTRCASDVLQPAGLGLYGFRVL